MELLNKIKNLISMFSSSRADSGDLSVVKSWEEEAKRLFLIQSLKNHDGIKYVLEVFTSEVAKINESLTNSYSKELSDRDRDRLLDKRDLAQKYINLFAGIDEKIEAIERDVDNAL